MTTVWRAILILLRAQGPAPPAADPRLAIVVAEATRAITGQQANLDNLRSRVGILLSAATIATSFLGGIALEREQVGVFGFVAIALFVLHVFTGLVILWPRHWTFQNSAATIVAWIDKDGVSEDRLHRRIAHWLELFYDRNEELLEPLWRLYAWAIGLLGLEIAAWLAELGGLEGWLRGLPSP